MCVKESQVSERSEDVLYDSVTLKRVLSIDDAIQEVGWTQRRCLVFFMTLWINIASGAVTTCISAIGHRADNLWGYNKVASVYLTPTLFGGLVVCTLFATPVLDRCGRRPPLFAMIAFLITGFGIMLASTNIYLLFIGAFVAGIGYADLEISMLMMQEFATGRWRDLQAALWNMSWTPGVMLSTALSVYAFPEDSQWRQLTACNMALHVVSLLLAILLAPESPRYLLGKQHHEDALDFFRWHLDKGFPVPCKKPKAELDFTLAPPEKVQHVSFLNVFNRKYIMLSIALWTCAFVGNGLYYSSVLDYPTNQATLFYLSFMELPSQLCWFGLGRLLGRPITIAILFGSEAIMFIIIITCGMQTWILYVSRFLMSAAYNYVWMGTPEAYPLAFRGSATMITGLVCNSAAVIIPVTKAYISQQIYSIILTVLAGIAAILGGLFMVDMTGKNMVDTMPENVSVITGLLSISEQVEYVESPETSEGAL